MSSNKDLKKTTDISSRIRRCDAQAGQDRDVPDHLETVNRSVKGTPLQPNEQATISVATPITTPKSEKVSKRKVFVGTNGENKVFKISKRNMIWP